MKTKINTAPLSKPSLAQSPHSKNLLILGILSISIAVITTIVSLVLYHNSGDIYLDRSRPGFLPDKEEVEQQPPDLTYSLNTSGPLDEQTLNSYIENFENTVEAIDDLEKPFSPTPLSDESLGIPAATL